VQPRLQKPPEDWYLHAQTPQPGTPFESANWHGPPEQTPVVEEEVDVELVLEEVEVEVEVLLEVLEDVLEEPPLGTIFPQ